MKKMILLFSHTLSESQKKQAKELYGVESFLSLPKKLQSIWSNISPELESVEEVMFPLKEFISSNANRDDVALIQGDFGGVYIMVNFCKEQKIKTLYATTKREAIEYINEQGEKMKKSKFEHVRFREYE